MAAVQQASTSHPSIAFCFAMNKFSVSILLLLSCFKICTAMKIHRNSNVGRLWLIKTKPGNLYLRHSKEAKKGNQFIQEILQAAAAGSIDGHDYLPTSGKNMKHTEEKKWRQIVPLLNGGTFMAFATFMTHRNFMFDIL